MSNPNDEATARALVEEWRAAWAVGPWFDKTMPNLIQRITAALAASRAEGEGQVAVLHSIASRMLDAIFVCQITGRWELKDALTTTAAAAQAHDAEVRTPLEAQLARLHAAGQRVMGCIATEALAGRGQPGLGAIAGLQLALTGTAAEATAYTAAVARQAARKERERCARVADKCEAAAVTLEWEACRAAIATLIRALRDDEPV